MKTGFYRTLAKAPEDWSPPPIKLSFWERWRSTLMAAAGYCSVGLPIQLILADVSRLQWWAACGLALIGFIALVETKSLAPGRLKELEELEGMLRAVQLKTGLTRPRRQDTPSD